MIYYTIYYTTGALYYFIINNLILAQYLVTYVNRSITVHYDNIIHVTM
jgi:hypothetical protein